MFHQWVRSIDRCSVCGFRFDRGEIDYFIGAYTLNLIIAELIVVGAMVMAIVSMWPDVPWQKLTWGLAAFALLGPVITYPFSKSLWLGIDLLFRPAEPNDFTSPAPASDAHP